MKEKQNVFDRFFGVTKSGSNMKTEIMAGMGLRMAIVHAIPDCVKSAMTAGIGLFITIIGLKNAGLVVGNDATFVSLVDFAQWRVEDADPSVIRGAIVLIFIIRYGFMTLG